MVTYLLTSKDEIERHEHISSLKTLIPDLVSIEAIYPSKTPIPFYDQIKLISKERTGSTLSDGALGCLLSHRVIWRRFLNQKEQDYCLILESDSKIDNLDIIQNQQASISSKYDLFFWGAWDGHARIHRSTTQFKEGKYNIGAPLIKSVYCTYGYSLNKKAAAYLLKATSKISYPVDIYKKYIQPGALAIGAARPEIIGAWYNTPSSIQEQSTGIKIKIFLIVQIFDLRNRIHAYFS